MRGVITERHFQSAERMFPGIRRFYDSLSEKPATFLELLWQYDHHGDGAQVAPRLADADASEKPV